MSGVCNCELPSFDRFTREGGKNERDKEGEKGRVVVLEEEEIEEEEVVVVMMEVELSGSNVSTLGFLFL